MDDPADGMRMDMTRVSEDTGGYFAHGVFNKCPICHSRLFRDPIESDTSPPTEVDDHTCLSEDDAAKRLRDASTPDSLLNICEGQDGTLKLFDKKEPVIFIGQDMFRVSCMSTYLIGELTTSKKRPVSPLTNEPIKAGEIMEVLQLTNDLQKHLGTVQENHEILLRIRQWMLDDLMDISPIAINGLDKFPTDSLEPRLLDKLKSIGAVTPLGSLDQVYFPFGEPFSERSLENPFRQRDDFYARFRFWSSYDDYFHGHSPPWDITRITQLLDNIWKQMFIIVQAKSVANGHWAGLSLGAYELGRFFRFDWLWDGLIENLMGSYCHMIFGMAGSHTMQISELSEVRLSRTPDTVFDEGNYDLWWIEPVSPIGLGEYLTVVHWTNAVMHAYKHTTVVPRRGVNAAPPMRFVKLEGFEEYMRMAPHRLAPAKPDRPPMKWWTPDDPESAGNTDDPTSLVARDVYAQAGRATVLINMLATLLKSLNVRPSAYGYRSLEELMHEDAPQGGIMPIYHLVVWTLCTTLYLEYVEFGNFMFWYTAVSFQDSQESRVAFAYKQIVLHQKTIYDSLADELVDEVASYHTTDDLRKLYGFFAQFGSGLHHTLKERARELMS